MCWREGTGGGRVRTHSEAESTRSPVSIAQVDNQCRREVAARDDLRDLPRVRCVCERCPVREKHQRARRADEEQRRSESAEAAGGEPSTVHNRAGQQRESRDRPML